MTERIMSTPEQIACVQLPEREFGLANDEMTQTLGGACIPIGGPPVIIFAALTYISDCVSEWWDSED